MGLQAWGCSLLGLTHGSALDGSPDGLCQRPPLAGTHRNHGETSVSVPVFIRTNSGRMLDTCHRSQPMIGPVSRSSTLPRQPNDHTSS